VKKFDKDIILEALSLMFAMAPEHSDEVKAFRHKVQYDRIITKMQAYSMIYLIESVNPGSHQGKSKLRVLTEWIKSNGPVPNFTVIQKIRDKADIICHQGDSLSEAEAEMAEYKKDGGQYRLNKSPLYLILP
jgi:hypothetical protein